MDVDIIYLSSKGLNEKFEDHAEEAKHFRKLCLKFTSFSEKWKSLEPSEVLLNCSPEAVNRNFNFNCRIDEAVVARVCPCALGTCIHRIFVIDVGMDGGEVLVILLAVVLSV